MSSPGLIRTVCLMIGIVFGAEGVGQNSKQEIDWVALLPDGAGRNSVLTHCMGCHGLDRIVVQQRAQGAWLGTGLRRLRFLSEEDVKRIVESRAKGNFKSLEEVQALLEPPPEKAELVPVYLKVRPPAE